MNFDKPLPTPEPSQPKQVATWKQHDPAKPLTYAAYRDTIAVLAPLMYSPDDGSADGAVQAYWMVLHGNPDPNSDPTPRCAWVTNGLWGSVVAEIIRTQRRMPKPADVETLCQVERGKLARLNPDQKALPADSTPTPRSGTIRAENMRAMQGFQREITRYSTALIDKGGERDRIISSCQREGYSGDKLRLAVAIRYAEARMARKRPTMPVFRNAGGFPSLEAKQVADRWNSKEDIQEELDRLRADWGAMNAQDDQAD